MSHIHRFKHVFARLEAGGYGMFLKCECGEYSEYCAGGASAPEKGAAIVPLKEVPEPLVRSARRIVMGKPAAMAYEKPALLM